MIKLEVDSAEKQLALTRSVSRQRFLPHRSLSPPMLECVGVRWRSRDIASIGWQPGCQFMAGQLARTAGIDLTAVRRVEGIDLS